MPFISTQSFSELIGLIHESALAPSLWSSALDRIRDTLHGSAALLFTPRHALASGGIVVANNLSPEVLSRYVANYCQHDVWNQAGIDQKRFVPGTVLTDEELVPRHQLLSSLYYRDFLAPANISRLCTSAIAGLDDPLSMPTTISVFGGLTARPFGKPDKDMLGLLVPHLSRALKMMYRLRDTEHRVAATLAALDNLACGILLFDRRGNVVHANLSASELLNENDGLKLSNKLDPERRLLASNLPQTNRLTQLVASAISDCAAENCTTSHAMRLPRKSGRPPMLLSISALPRNHEFETAAGQSVAIGFLFDTALSSLPLPRMLVELYGLSPAESRLVTELGRGWTIAEMARHHGVSTETVKCQLKSVFFKTGTHRQSDVVRLSSTMAIKK